MGPEPRAAEVPVPVAGLTQTVIELSRDQTERSRDFGRLNLVSTGSTTECHYLIECPAEPSCFVASTTRAASAVSAVLPHARGS